MNKVNQHLKALCKSHKLKTPFHELLPVRKKTRTTTHSCNDYKLYKLRNHGKPV